MPLTRLLRFFIVRRLSSAFSCNPTAILPAPRLQWPVALSTTRWWWARRMEGIKVVHIASLCVLLLDDLRIVIFCVWLTGCIHYSELITQ